MLNKEDKNMHIQTSAKEHEQDLSFKEQLKLLSKSAGTAHIGEKSDQICREVRGKE